MCVCWFFKPPRLGVSIRKRNGCFQHHRFVKTFMLCHIRLMPHTPCAVGLRDGRGSQRNCWWPRFLAMCILFISLSLMEDHEMGPRSTETSHNTHASYTCTLLFLLLLWNIASYSRFRVQVQGFRPSIYVFRLVLLCAPSSLPLRALCTNWAIVEPHPMVHFGEASISSLFFKWESENSLVVCFLWCFGGHFASSSLPPRILIRSFCLARHKS